MIKLTLCIKLRYNKDKKFYDSFAKGFKSLNPYRSLLYFRPLPDLNLHVVALDLRDTTPYRTYRFFFLIKDVIYEKENKDRLKD